MLSRDLDPSEPLITPERMLDYHRRLLGLDEGALALPEVLVATFQRVALQHLAARIGDEVPAPWPTPIFWPLARGSHGGKPLAVARFPVGASAATLALEMMVAAGVRTVVLVGSAGSIQSHVGTGSLVIPTRAIRDEGTSYHYVPSDEVCEPSPELVDALLSCAARRGLPPPATGPTWTTDAPYRECADTVERHRAAGVLTVEMEAAALFGVARHRGVRAALIVAVSDELREDWTAGFHTLAYRRALVEAAEVALEAATAG